MEGTEVIGGAFQMSAEQITSVSTALTNTVSGVVDSFVELLPVIAVTTGAIFAIRFIKGRFRKVERIG